MSLLDCDWTKDAIISDLCKAFLPKFTILAESFYISGSSVQLCPIPAPYICASFVLRLRYPQQCGFTTCYVDCRSGLIATPILRCWKLIR